MRKPEIHIRPFLLNALHAFGKLSIESKKVDHIFFEAD